MSVPPADGADRRRRFLALVESAHAVQLVACGVLVAMTEPPGTTKVPYVLVGAGFCAWLAYILLRIDERASRALYVATNLAIVPLVVALDGAHGMSSPFACLTFLVPTILLANAIATTWSTIVVGALALVTTLGALVLWTPHPWADLRHGSIFVLTNLFLVVVFGVHRDRVEDDRSAQLRARNRELESLRDSLERRVRQRTRRVTLRNRELQLVLDNVAEGLFTIDEEGTIVSDPSAVVTRRFDMPEQGAKFYDYLGGEGSAFALSARLAWKQLAAEALPREVALAQIPTTLMREGRLFQLVLKPIENDDAKFLLVLSDITDERDRLAQVRMQNEKTMLLRRMLLERRALLEFVADSSAMVRRICSSNADRSRLRHDVHTLKGNALLAELGSVAEACAQLEDVLAEDQPEHGAREALRTAWEAITSEVETIIAARGDFIEVAVAEHRTLLEEAGVHGSDSALYRRLESLAREPVGPRLERLRSEAERLARSLEKDVRVEVIDDGLRLDGKDWAPFWASLVHAVRNAVDHGIEPAIERTARGKGGTGNVWLRARRRGAFDVVEVGDDGRGIDWHAVRTSALAAGKAVASDDDLLEAVLADGISTAPGSSEVSGRGVGMGALRSATTQLGGELLVHSAPGEGTLIEMRFPVRAVETPSHDSAVRTAS